MILGDVFERFVQDSPVSVTTHALLENALPPSTVDSLFATTAERQDTRNLLFPALVNLLGGVVCRIRRSITAASTTIAEPLGVTRTAVSKTLDRIALGIGVALVRPTAAALGPVITARNARREPGRSGDRTRIVDGSHRPGTAPRITCLRSTRAGALPGQALVVFGPASGRVDDLAWCEDGHSPARSMTDDLLALVPHRDPWIADRNFSTTTILFGIAARGGSFRIRQHGSTWTGETVGERVSQGRCETGEVFEQTLHWIKDRGETRRARRITVEWDRPTRDGERTIPILTNLPEADADALTVAAWDRTRWTIATAVPEREASRNGELNPRGDPPAAWFAFGIARVSSHVRSTITAALRSVHGEAAAEAVSDSDRAEEVAGTHRGMMIAVLKDEWVVFPGLSPDRMGQFVKEWAGAIRRSDDRKQTRGPKKPRPERRSGAKIKQVATSKLLKNQKS